MKLETELTGKLGAMIKKVIPAAIFLKHSDGATAGVPDFSVTWLGLTSWHEVKVADPEFMSQGVQELTCCRLAIQGCCDYIIYNTDPRSVSIVAPNSLANWSTDRILYLEGYDHVGIAAYIADLHRQHAARRVH
jgi:hypothetical protein